jgi:hypothetical protein
MADSAGTWDPVLANALGIVGVHAVVLHTGKVLYWCFDQRAVGQLGKNNNLFDEFFNNPDLGSYQIWDPASNPPSAGPVQAIGRNSFCAGQCALPDGTIFVAGGQDGAGAVEVTGEWDKWGSAVFGGAINGASKDVHTYDPVSDSWSRWPDMADGRYYPTCVVLPDGRGFVAGGLSNLQEWVLSNSNFCENDQFETVTAGALFAGPTPQQKFRSADQYPILRLLPGTSSMFVHIETESYIFDLDNSAFVPGAEFSLPQKDAAGENVGRQTYPMQTGHVLLPQAEGEEPRILIVGGSTFSTFNYNAGVLGLLDFVQSAPALRGAFIFEYNSSDPVASRWREAKGEPTIARLLADTVLLPDGTVFVVNGIAAGAAAGHSKGAVIQAEIFDPATETFTQVASPDPAHPRGYHSTAVLLPSGKVAIAGNTYAYNPGETPADDDVSIQVYSPPYLSSGQPPVVRGVPAEIVYGSTLSLDTSAGPPVAKAMLMRPCAVTHTVDMDQRAVVLAITGGAGTVSVKVPTDHALAPPGYYMLFFLTEAGAPAEAAWVRLKDAKPDYPALDLGTYTGPCVIDEVFDGDLTLEKIDQHCNVTLESRHGSITIKHKIDQHSYANLKAAGTVTIGEGIDQHSQAQITAGGDVKLGMKINEYSQAWITSTTGSIDIGQMVDNTSEAHLTAGTTVHIGQTLNQHSVVTIQAHGDVNIDQSIDQHVTANITSDTGNVNIGQKIDEHSTAVVTASKGSINIGEGLSGNATATLQAPLGDINIGDSVDNGSTLNWDAIQLNCPHQDGTITRF